MRTGSSVCRFDGLTSLAVELGGMVELREATPADGPAVLDVHREAIGGVDPGEYTEAQLDAWLAAQDDPDQYPFEDGTQYLAVAETDERIVGFAGLDLDRGVVETLYVRPDAAGRGVGTALLDRVERVARDRGHEALLTGASRNAVGFYERRGYAAEGTVEVSMERETVEFVKMRKRFE